MVVNQQMLWGCEFYAYGHRTYILQGFLNKQRLDYAMNILHRNTVGERRVYRGAKV